MVAKISPEIEKEISKIWKELGYKSGKEFIEDALRYWILELKKTKFLAKTAKIQEAMKEKGIKEKDILKEFKIFSHSK
jgi:repressor of nif and glnA expression